MSTTRLNAKLKKRTLLSYSIWAALFLATDAKAQQSTPSCTGSDANSPSLISRLANIAQIPANAVQTIKPSDWEPSYDVENGRIIKVDQTNSYFLRCDFDPTIIEIQSTGNFWLINDVSHEQARQRAEGVTLPSITSTGGTAVGVNLSSIDGAGWTGMEVLSWGTSSQSAGDLVAYNGPGTGGAPSLVTGYIYTVGGFNDAMRIHSTGGNGEEGTSVNNNVLRVGGSGENGTNAGSVKVINEGVIRTQDFTSTGISAMSIGGNGGAGTSVQTSNTFSSISVGGNGGNGGLGGDVTVTNGSNGIGGEITTLNLNSIGIKAQSIGGGGGEGGAAKSQDTSIFGGFSMAIGGNGGTGGHAGAVTVNHESGTVKTEGVFGAGTPAAHSVAILAQSIGGGGGNGGHAVVMGDTNVFPSVHIDVSKGGSGGAGGAGEAVTVGTGTNASIITLGRHSGGIVAQSIGGGGGNGGTAVNADSGKSAASLNVSVGMGGHGSGGGSSAKVHVAASGDIRTSGDKSAGIIAQSISGSGGNGGNVVSSISSASLVTANVSADFGGSAGDGATAGSVSADIYGSSTTFGDHAAGLFAQSIGGGGGNGGSVHVYSAALGGAGPVTLNGTVNLGGKGGLGGNADAATSAIHGNIETYGVHSFGVHLQSVGGGGGNGGHIHTLQETANLSPYSRAISATVNVGGTGGSGGDGSLGLAIFDGSIKTHQARSFGLVVQSIGGGGGSGGATQSVTATSGVPENPLMALARFERPDLLAGTEAKDSLNVTANIGGKGGSGGIGGAVNLRLNGGSITTMESQSHGIVAHSVGGGGGMGGNVNATGFAGINTYSFDLAIGGAAGSGNRGGNVAITRDSGKPRTQVTTSGNHGFGILAQSIGGGGGEGGSAHTDVGKIPVLGNSAFAVSLGGNGGTGGTGGAVTISDVNITTSGVQSHGVMAQSIGGGGGNATITGSTGTTSLSLGGNGGSGNHGGNVSLTDILVNTSGELAAGLVAQSIGGGGGAAGLLDANGASSTANQTANSLFKLSTMGDAGDGGAININHGINTTTSGTTAVGVLAQSIGNGGSATFINNGTAQINYTPVSIGGSASGLVTFSDATGGSYVVNTSGHGAVGLIAQSIAGSGGALFSNGSLANVNVDSNFLVGGGSSGGLDLILDNSQISTTGDYAPGLFLQSGNSIFTVFAADGQASYHGKQSGFATLGVSSLQVTNRFSLGSGGSISTSGQNSHGVVFETNSYFGSTAKQSASANDRSMSIWIDGAVSVSGKDSWAVKASNAWKLSDQLIIPGNTDITTALTIGSGGSIGASGDAAGGIYISDVGNMTIDVNGSINAGSLTALQIGEPTSNTITININNNVTGDIKTDAYTRGTDYKPQSSATAAKISNSGHTIAGSVLGNFDYSITNQGAHGLTVDAASNSADMLDVQTFTLERFSHVDLTLSSLPTPEFTGFELIKAQNSNIPENFDPFNRQPNNQIIFYETTENGGSITLTDIKIDIDQQDFLNEKSGAYKVAPLAQKHIEAIRDGSLNLQQSSNLYKRLLIAVNAGSHPGRGYANAMEWLSGLIPDPDTQSASNAGSSTSDKVHSCGVASSLNPIEQTECIWSSFTQVESQLGNASHEESSSNLTAGAQYRFNDNSFWGYGVGIDKVEIDRSKSDATGERFHLAGVYKNIAGNFFYSTSLVGSYSRIDAKRSFLDELNDGQLINARSERETLLLTGRARTGYRFETPYVDITPVIDVDIFLAHQLEYAEEDAGGVGMLVDDSTNLLFDLHPRVEFGRHFDSMGGVRLFGTFGARFALNDPSVNVGFVDGLAGAGTIEVTHERESVLPSYGLGMTTDLNEKFELRASYDVVDGSDEKQERFSIKLGYRF